MDRQGGRDALLRSVVTALTGFERRTKMVPMEKIWTPEPDM
jgi:hypothetical protein